MKLPQVFVVVVAAAALALAAAAAGGGGSPLIVAPWAVAVAVGAFRSVWWGVALALA